MLKLAPGTYKYTLKLLNTQRNSEFSMRRLDSKCIFCSVDVLKDEIGRLVRAQFSNVGYIRPAHGWKGKQELIDSNDDLQEMYSAYGNKKDILL